MRLLSCVTPENAESERVRLLRSFEQGDGSMPRWSYARASFTELRRALERAEHELASTDDAVARLYAARLREIADEADVASACGTTALGGLAKARFASTDDAVVSEARARAQAWAANRDTHDGEPLVESDGTERGSLLTRLREEVGKRRLPFVVVVDPRLVALAATGERHILVASKRRVTREDVERTVVHEIEAHALPRTRAAGASLGIFRFGTARGIDDQEGLALVIEERHGFLGPRRTRELGVRHLAVLAMDDGATFVDTVKTLVRDHDVPIAKAVLVAERVHRGGTGIAGLGRERIYIEAFLRVSAAFQKTPSVEAVVANGQVGLDAAAVLAAWVTSVKNDGEDGDPTETR